MMAWRRVWLSNPLRASTSSTARSALDAPVAMLRVYCSWPGVSATMKARRAGREITVGHVDGDALLALGLQAVEQQREIDLGAVGAVLFRIAFERGQMIVENEVLLVEQAADQSRLAVVDRAAGQEAQGGARIGAIVAHAHASRRLATGAFIRNIPRAFSSPSIRTSS